MMTLITAAKETTISTALSCIGTSLDFITKPMVDDT